MQPQEQISAASASLSWIGAEFTSILQLLFFLTLGYAVTRSFIWSKTSRGRKAPAKKLDDVDHVLEEIQGTSCSESDSIPAGKNKASKNNAIERKNKKTKEVLKKDELSKPNVPAVPEPAPVLLEDKPQDLLPEQHTEQCLPESEVDSPQPLTDSAEDMSTAVSERVAKLMAKKMQRKAKKAQEKTEAEEKTFEEETCPPVVEEPDKETKIVALVEATPDAEALSDDMAQAASTPSMIEITPSNIQNDEPPVEIIPVVPEEVEENVESPSIRKTVGSSDTLDNMETDAQSDSDEVHSSLPEGISTPERCLTPPQEMNVDPMMWCGAGVPQIEGWMAIAVPMEYAPAGAPGPFDGLWTNNADERIVVDHEEILFESGMKWVMEMQSLTSLSVNVANEVFTAEMDAPNQRLLWSDGDIWTCVGQTDGQQRWAADREAMGMPGVLLDGEQLFPMSHMDCTDQMEMVPQDQMDQMNEMMMMMPIPTNQLVPEDAKTWETCWDWSKKGWCPRGLECDWYHPMEPQQQFQNCAPCGSAAPFAEYDDFAAPFGDFAAGPIF